MLHLGFYFVLCASLQTPAPAPLPAPRVDTRSLLREIPSREELARFPQPAYTLESNAHVLRWEEHAGRREAVLAEAKGAGAFVRLWLADPIGRLRLYFGDKQDPGMVLETRQLFSPVRGTWPTLRNSGLALARMPFPFAQGARLTLECAVEPRFEVAWRSYPEGSLVGDWSMPATEDLESLGQAWDRTPRGPDGQQSYTLSLSDQNPAGEFLASDPKLCAGPRAVSEIVLRVDGPDKEAAARGLVLHLWFDGEETVVCPVTALFRCTQLEPRIHALWTRDFLVRWPMPYRERMDLFVENLGPPSTHVSGTVYTQPWSWDERSLHFGARWIAARGATRLSIEGQGVLLGIVPGGIPADSPVLTAELDSKPQPLRAALALLDRAPFRERLQFELPLRTAADPQRVAIFYVRPGAKITSRDPQPEDRASLADDL